MFVEVELVVHGRSTGWLMMGLVVISKTPCSLMWNWWFMAGVLVGTDWLCW